MTTDLQCVICLESEDSDNHKAITGDHAFEREEPWGLLRGALYCIDTHYGVSGTGPCDCDQAVAVRDALALRFRGRERREAG
jgi:hypothetical protein